MANPETIINSLRQQCTNVFDTLQDNLQSAADDKADFLAEESATFFSDWFDTATTDITFQDLADAVAAMETLLTTFEQDSVRRKLQVVRTR
jgi:Sec7-like guanine-nucleotide exchange factor